MNSGGQANGVFTKPPTSQALPMRFESIPNAGIPMRRLAIGEAPTDQERAIFGDMQDILTEVEALLSYRYDVNQFSCSFFGKNKTTVGCKNGNVTIGMQDSDKNGMPRL